VILVRRCDLFGQIEYSVLESEQDPWVHLECQVKIQGAATALFGVKVHLPGLAEGVGLDEVPFVMDMESMIDGMVFQVGHVPCHIDYCHSRGSLIAG
jgi:hypothetical protein